MPKKVEPGLTLSPLTEFDLEEVTALEKICFPTPWSRRLFMEELGRQDTCRWVIARDGGGRLTGYMGWWKVADEAHVTNLAVNPGFRRQGVGTVLVAQMLQAARQQGCVRATLEVRPSNDAAIRLYEGFGFKSAALRPSYYSDNGEDALVMWNPDLEKA